MEEEEKETAPLQEVEVCSSFKKLVVSEKGSCMEAEKEEDAALFQEALQRFSEESSCLEEEKEAVSLQVQSRLEKPVAAEKKSHVEEKKEEESL